MANLNKLLKNDLIKTAVALALIAAIVLGFFFGLSIILGTSMPLRVVESGSMCTEPMMCDGWSHPFTPTLHVGDIIIIQAVNPADLNVDYPNSDIIVYQNPNDPTGTPIVHRIVANYTDENGTLRFQTKGDGNGENWPAIPDQSQYDSHSLWTTGEGVSQDQVLGKVIMRIPILGWITLFMKTNSWALPLVVVAIMLLVVIEFVLPAMRHKKGGSEQQNRGVEPS
jgi:signal peptidase I